MSKANATKTSAGVWIDHREAVIVVLRQHEEVTTRIASDVEKQLRRSGTEPSGTSFEAQLVPADDSQERAYTSHLVPYYAEVIATLRRADAILVFGPGEAKGELKRELVKESLGSRVVAVEAADKMTEPQIVQKVRKYFGLSPSAQGSRTQN